MEIFYYFSSPQGDVPIDSETLARPFIVEPSQTHPFMTLGDFFHLVAHFFFGRAAPYVASELSRSWERDVALEDIDTVIIRYEKYGTLYQISSAEVVAGTQKATFAVSAALTPAARENIKQEYNLIAYINTKTGASYLPNVFFIYSQDIRKENEVDTVVLTLAEWFEGYHEWHFSKDEDGRARILIWDMGGGKRFASDQEAFAIIKEASRILTLYYNVETGERIFPWHHGAGDFVVKTSSTSVDVKLVTARGYEPYMSCDSIEALNPSWGLLQFFVDLTTRMRLDKDEGMGDSVWAANSMFCTASVEGFLEAMKAKEVQGQCGIVSVADFTTSLKTLSQDKALEIMQSQLEMYQDPETSDYRVVNEHLEEHARDLVNVLQHLSS